VLTIAFEPYFLACYWLIDRFSSRKPELVVRYGHETPKTEKIIRHRCNSCGDRTALRVHIFTPFDRMAGPGIRRGIKRELIGLGVHSKKRRVWLVGIF